MSELGVIGQEMFIESGTAIINSYQSESGDIHISSSVPSTHEPIIVVQVISLKTDDGETMVGAYGSHLQNVNSFLRTSAPTYNGINWQFKVRRSVGDSYHPAHFTRVQWKIVALKDIRQIGASVTPASEA